ncbi:hypothetical protein BH23CHL7_BH23CHL7_24060 [soil metagenome]
MLAAGLRIFIGFKLLHEIWTGTAPGVNALPGFAPGEAQAPVFESIAASHWPLVGGLVEGLVLPHPRFDQSSVVVAERVEREVVLQPTG